MKQLYRFAAVALLILGLFAWWYYQPKRVLARKLDNLIADLSFDPSTTRSSRLIKSSSIGGYFDQQVEITSPIDEANGNFSPEDLNSGFSFLSENAREISIQRAEKLTTTLDGKHATMEFDADVKVSITRWLKGLNGRYAVIVHWRKTEQGWKIHSSSWQEIP